MITWAIIKKFTKDRLLSIQYVDYVDYYFLKAIDGELQLEYNLLKDGGEDHLDFEVNFKTLANKPIVNQFDSDRAIISRVKQAPTGYTYILKALDFTTATFGSLNNMDTKGVDFGDVTMTFKDANDLIITDPALLSTTCTTTLVDFEPKFDYYLIGGTAKIIQTPTQDLRMWVIMAPDIPAIYGGSKALICNINFKFIQPGDKVEADGRAAKQLTYSAINHSSKMRFIFKHTVGASNSLGLFIEYYRA